MTQVDTKLDKFTSAVLRDAKKQRDEILREIEEYRKTQMEKAEKDALNETYQMIQNEIAAAHDQQSRQISLAELKARKRLLQLREDLMRHIFEQARQKIREYANTTTYVDALCASVKKACAAIGEGKVILRVRSEDLNLADRLREAAGRPATVESGPEIQLGGFLLMAPDQGLISDESLDRKLADQQGWFTSSSGLSIGL